MPPRRYRPRRGPRPQRKRTGGAAAAIAEAQAAARPTGPVELPNPVVIKDLGEKLAVSHAEIINVLIRNGIFATVNQSIDFDTASLVASELGYEATEAIRAVGPQMHFTVQRRNGVTLMPLPSSRAGTA